MTVSPSPRPDTSISLFPRVRDLKQGNAAVFYQRSQSLEWWGPHFRKHVHQAIESLEKPWDAKVELWNENWGPLKELDVAARSEFCDWQLLERTRAEGMMMLVPDLQAMRTLGAANSVRIREAIHKGRWDRASYGLQTQYAMAKHVGEAPLLISYLVGRAIADVSVQNLEEWVQEPDSPNLFWALTELPRPLIDWRRPLESEALLNEVTFPEIHQALHGGRIEPIPPRTLADRLKKYAGLSGHAFDAVAFAVAAAEAEPRARAHFLAKGLSAEDIDRLPVTQLVLMDAMQQGERRTNELLPLQNLPYWQAAPFLKKLRAQEDQEAGQHPILSRALTSTALFSIFARRPNSERPFAMLRCVEALRIHAGQNDGQWPDSLDDLKDGAAPLPLPVDPYTGKSFVYRREGATAILEAFAPPGVPHLPGGIRYELTIRRK